MKFSGRFQHHGFQSFGQRYLVRHSDLPLVLCRAQGAAPPGDTNVVRSTYRLSPCFVLDGKLNAAVEDRICGELIPKWACNSDIASEYTRLASVLI